MHCAICKIDFNTLSTYVQHHRDFHSHSKNIRLICSCGGAFSTLRSIQSHWSRFHQKEKRVNSEDMRDDAQEDDDDDIGCIGNQTDYSVEANDPEGEDSERESTSVNDTMEDLTEEEQLEMLEKRILYLLLTLQTTFYASEVAITFVVKSLTELFLAISKMNLNLAGLAVRVEGLKSTHLRRKKAEEYFQYIEPISRSYQTTVKNNEIKTVKYTYVPFLSSLMNYLQLPEVQADLHRPTADYDPNAIRDVYDGEFARNHPDFRKSTYLKIELNSDDLTITNPISHRAHSVFFFYWSLLNVSREKRSRQAAKRLIAICPKWARKYNSLSHTIDDFLMGMQTLSTTGLTVDINGKKVTYFGSLFISLGDYPAQMSLNGFKESVAATHFCHLCDIQRDNLEEDICFDFPRITQSQYRDRCDDLERIQNDAQSFQYLSKTYGINNRSLFDQLYDVTRQCPYDIMHTLLEGVLQNHLNAFLQFCIQKGYFRINEFCREVNEFPYEGPELNAKPYLNLTLDELKKQNNLGMPLTSMQTFYLFFNLPFILKKLLQSSDFPEYRAMLLCVDILSLCFAATINDATHRQLHRFINLHNSEFRRFYPQRMKFKFHFMTHFPSIMKDFGPLAYTSCLATERKHQFFKGNKVRNLKNVSLTLARRHELWISVNDRCFNGSFSHTAISEGPLGQLDDQQPINDHQIQFVISNIINLPFKPLSTLKILTVNGYKYSRNSVLNVSKEDFPQLPTVGKVKWILFDGKNCAFVCTIYMIKNYVQDLRAFEVQSTNQIKSFVLKEIAYKKPLKLVSLNGSLYFPLHPYGKSSTVI